MKDTLARISRRILMVLIGWCFVGLEAYGTFEFLSEKHGKWAFMTLAGVAITAAGAGFLPLVAEDGRRHGRWGLKWGAWMAVPLVMTFVFIASIQRTSSSINADEQTITKQAEQVRIARSEEAEALTQLPTDKAEVARNCTPWGPKCQRAKDDQQATEAKLAGARGVLKVHGAASNYSLAATLSGYLPFWTKDQINLYMPLLQPLCLTLLGTIFLASGYSNGVQPRPAPAETPGKGHGWRFWRKPASEPSTALAVTPATVEAEIIEPPRPAPPVPPEPVAVSRLKVISSPKHYGPVGDWMLACLQPGGEVEWTIAFKDSYWPWCAENKFDPNPGDKFGQQLEAICLQKGIEIRRRGKKVYLLGLSLKVSYKKASSS